MQHTWQRKGCVCVCVCVHYLFLCLPMQGVQSKKDTPKGYVPPWKRVHEKQTKEGSKSSPKPAESMTASRMSSFSEHASVKPRKTPLSSGAAPSRKTGSRSELETLSSVSAQTRPCPLTRTP